MSNSVDAVTKALAHYRDSFESAKKAASVLAGGPADFYFERIAEYIDALFNKFAPFKEGGRVSLTAAPRTDGHWSGSRHFLIPGALGTVASVDYTDGQFCADVVFDDESWIDDKGVVRPKMNRHTYRIEENLLKREGATMENKHAS